MGSWSCATDAVWRAALGGAAPYKRRQAALTQRMGSQSCNTGAPLRVVLGGGAPHERVQEVGGKRAVNLVAQRLHLGAAAVRRQHHRVRKVGLAAHLRAAAALSTPSASLAALCPFPFHRRDSTCGNSTCGQCQCQTYEVTRQVAGNYSGCKNVVLWTWPGPVHKICCQHYTHMPHPSHRTAGSPAREQAQAA